MAIVPSTAWLTSDHPDIWASPKNCSPMMVVNPPSSTPSIAVNTKNTSFGFLICFLNINTAHSISRDMDENIVAIDNNARLSFPRNPVKMPVPMIIPSPSRVVRIMESLVSFL